MKIAALRLARDNARKANMNFAIRLTKKYYWLTPSTLEIRFQRILSAGDRKRAWREARAQEPSEVRGHHSAVVGADPGECFCRKGNYFVSLPSASIVFYTKALADSSKGKC